MTCFPHRCDSERAWVRQRRRAGIGYECDRFALGQEIQNALRGAALVMLMKGNQPSGDPVLVEKSCGDPRIFRGYDVDRFQNVERAQRDVGEISNRRSDYI